MVPVLPVGLHTDKLWLMVAIMAWMVMCLSVMGGIGLMNSPYFRVGPSPNLMFAGSHIDTWEKWIFLMMFRVLSTYLETATVEMVTPWITTHIQNEDRKDLPYPRWKCNAIVTLRTLYVCIDKLLELFSAFSQVDIVIAEWVTTIFVTQVWTLPLWMKGKTFPQLDAALRELTHSTEITTAYGRLDTVENGSRRRNSTDGNRHSNSDGGNGSDPCDLDNLNDCNEYTRKPKHLTVSD